MIPWIPGNHISMVHTILMLYLSFCFNLENVLQFMHCPHQVHLSFFSPCRNRNIPIYIITFSDRLSNPNPKSKAALPKKMQRQTHWKWPIRKKDICWQQSICLLEKSFKIWLYFSQPCQQCFFASQISGGAREGEDHRILLVRKAEGWALEDVTWAGSMARTVSTQKRTWGFSCPLHKLWGFLSVEGQSVPKIQCNT